MLEALLPILIYGGIGVLIVLLGIFFFFRSWA